MRRRGAIESDDDDDDAVGGSGAAVLGGRNDARDNPFADFEATSRRDYQYLNASAVSFDIPDDTEDIVFDDLESCQQEVDGIAILEQFQSQQDVKEKLRWSTSMPPDNNLIPEDHDDLL